MTETDRYSAQDGFMNYAKSNNVTIKFYLIENIQMKGKIKHFDMYSVILENEETGNDNLIFKHAIIAMIPSGKFSIEYTAQTAKHS
ncbi:RNA chaperone Hfq [Athalassotoga sp.]|uniref:RNA chaperone Hfq n=1 Tax=Athalassotoga sp. TaxID=2022597 RepID=UPI003CFF5489